MENNASPENKPTSSDGWQRVIAIIPVFIIVVGLFQIAGASLIGLDSDFYLKEKTPLQDMILGLFMLAGSFATVFTFKLLVDKESIISLGFYPTACYKEIIAGILIGTVMISLGFFILLQFKEIYWSNTIIELLNLIFSFLLFISVAISEELIFRGYILSNLMRSIKPGFALIITSLLFSIIHFPGGNFSWISFSNIFLAGILLGLPYIYTQSLWFPIAMHFSWNFFQGPIYGFNVSGNETYSIIQQSRVEENIINGGSFGFEGSVLCLIIQVIAIIIIWLYLKKNFDCLSQ
ncbi:MAG: CPBP family intramembrane metalloprotease [Bacteroidales bacterium]|nr:CPBP family intramembrane metalloprotease [Bacteroidales bacterium]